MKKLTKVFGLLAMASMLFFACKPTTDGDTKNDNTEQNGGGQGTGSGQSTGGGQGTGTGGGQGSGGSEAGGTGSGGGSGQESGNGNGQGTGTGQGSGSGQGTGSGNGQGTGTGQGSGTSLEDTMKIYMEMSKGWVLFVNGNDFVIVDETKVDEVDEDAEPQTFEEFLALFDDANKLMVGTVIESGTKIKVTSTTIEDVAADAEFDMTVATDGTISVTIGGETYNFDVEGEEEEVVVAKKYTVLVDETEKTYKVSDEYGGTTFYGSNGIALKAGSWLIWSATVEFADIGQVYAQIGGEGGNLGSYPQLPQACYTTDTGTNSIVYSMVYKFEKDCTLKMMKFSHNKATGSAIEKLPVGAEVVIKNLKAVVIDAGDIDTVAPNLLKESEVDLTWDNTENDTSYCFTLDNVPGPAAAVGDLLVFRYTRDAISEGYKNHYINTKYVINGEDGCYNAVYPDQKAGTITGAFPILKAAENCDWGKIGIACSKIDDKDAISITDAEVRVVPFASMK